MNSSTIGLMSRLVVLVVTFLCVFIDAIEVLNDISNQEYDNFLKNLATNHSDIVKLHSLGKSSNEDVYAVQLSSGFEGTLKPAVLFAANLEGSDILGKHVLMLMASYLSTNYNKNSRVTKLLKNADVYIVPTIKPSVLENSGRCVQNATCSVSNSIRFKDLPSETKMFLSWVSSKSMVLTVVLNSGIPLCVRPESGDALYFNTPSHNAFVNRMFALIKNGTSYQGDTCPQGAYLNGYTPNYLFSNSFELSVELHCCNNAPLQLVKEEWSKHSNSLLSLAEVSQWGVRGTVVSEGHLPVEGATIEFIGDDLNYNITTSSKGEFWRLLLPKNYKIKIYAPTYQTLEKDVNLSNETLILEPIILKSLPPTSSLIQTEGEIDEYGFVSKIEFKHHNYEEMKNMLSDLASEYRDITLLYSIGKSVQGRELYVLEISKHPGMHEAGEPEVKIVANMHGNEVIGKEVTLLLATYLCQNYGRDEKITTLINTTRIHLLPSMNPDGYEISQVGDYDGVNGRNNANGVDLNRNFPDQFGVFRENRVQEPETSAVINWFNQYHFVLSANLHGGALVANYPYDDNKMLKGGKEALTPDHDTFVLLSSDYARLNTRMHLGQPCPNSSESFPGGITNGAKWYIVTGGMQDYNYVQKSTMEITVEMGCFKFPPAEQLPRFWMENRDSLVHFLEQAHMGFSGFVKSSSGKLIKDAAIKVSGIEKVVVTAEFGDYWRLITPGSYAVTAMAKGYSPQTKTVRVPRGVHGGVLNFTLKPFAPEIDFTKDTETFGDNEIITSYLPIPSIKKLLEGMDSDFPELVQFSQGPPGGFSSIKITDNVGAPSEEKIHVAVFGSLYNAEPAGRDLALRLAKRLIHGYSSKDPNTTYLLKNTVIHIIPAIDRVYDVPCLSSTPDSNPFALDFVSNTVFKKPLVNSFVQFIKDESLDLLISIEGGGSSLMYPQSNDSITSVIYQSLQKTFDSKKPYHVKCSESFGGPIVAVKELVRNLVKEKFQVDMVSAEVSCCYYNPAQYVLEIWKQYQSPLMSLLFSSAQGIRAYISDGTGHPMRRAKVFINSSPLGYSVTPNQGIFMKSFPPGKYHLKISSLFHEGKEVSVLVEEGRFTNIKVELVPIYMVGPPPNVPEKGSGIVGYILDPESHLIKGVTLQFVKSNVSFTHNVDGTFWVPLEKGEYLVTASASGFSPITKIVDITSEEPKESVFTLEKSHHMFGMPRLTFVLLLATGFMMLLGLIFFCHSLCSGRRNRHKGFFLIPTKATLFTDEDSNEIYKTPIRSTSTDYNVMPYYDNSDCEDYNTESEEEIMVVNQGQIQMR